MKEIEQKIVNGKINYKLECYTPKDFVVSQWQVKEKSTVYVFYRWAMACFFFFSFFFSLNTSRLRGELKVHFAYLTNWNMLGSLFLTVLGAILTTMHYKDNLKIDKMTRSLKVFWFLSITHTLYAALVSFIYWTILFGKEKTNVIDMNNVIVHITNSVLIIDIFVVKYKWNMAQFIFPFTFGIVYLAFTIIYPLLGGLNKRGEPFIYSIFDWKENALQAILCSICTMILGATFHCFFVLVHHLRDKVHRKVSAKTYQNVLTNIRSITNFKDIEAQKY